MPAKALPTIDPARCTGTAWQTARDERGARGGTGTTAVVLRGGEHRMGLLVDRIEAQREAVVRPLGRLFAGHPFLNSATSRSVTGSV